jgi:hypothetical protein
MMLSPSLANQLQRTSWWTWPDLNGSIIRASPIWQTPPTQRVSFGNGVGQPLLCALACLPRIAVD